MGPLAITDLAKFEQGRTSRRAAHESMQPMFKRYHVEKLQNTAKADDYKVELIWYTKLRNFGLSGNEEHGGSYGDDGKRRNGVVGRRQQHMHDSIWRGDDRVYNLSSETESLASPVTGTQPVNGPFPWK